MIYIREKLIGKWYRNDLDDEGNQVSEYAHMLADGSYEFSFIYHDAQGEVIHQIIELGDWGLVGDVHFTMTKSEFIDNEHYAVDLNDADNYNAYRVLELTNQTFKYQHVYMHHLYRNCKIQINSF